MSAPKPTEVPSPRARGILVVDDHDLVRLGLRTLLLSHAGTADIALEVFEARSLQAAVDVYRRRRSQIGLVLLDLNLPDTRGLAGLQAFMAEFPGARVAVLSGSTDPVLMRRTLELGAAAYLAKSADLQYVVDHLRGAGFFDADPVAVTARGAGAGQPADGGVTEVWTAAGERVQLTRRQAEVLEWMLAGHSNRQIAEHTHLSEGTIKNHVSALLLMFGARSRAQLISQLR
jgi:DNA-binding NarL/FixJ family response regulator